MPNTKSAIKAMRVSQRRRVINLATIDKYKTAIKTVRKAVAAKDKSEAVKSLSLAYQQIDKAVKKNVIHANKGSRLKSRLSHAISKIQ